jgi:hypothetical protein
MGARLITLTRGVIRLTADWNVAANKVDIYLTDYACGDHFAPTGPPPCDKIFAKADAANRKPQVLEACLDAGTYWFWLLQRGPDRDDTGFVRIELPPGTPPSGTPPPS